MKVWYNEELGPKANRRYSQIPVGDYYFDDDLRQLYLRQQDGWDKVPKKDWAKILGPTPDELAYLRKSLGLSRRVKL